MATYDDGTTDDSSNYTHPVTTAGPTKFTGKATASDSATAEELAREAARSQAMGSFGSERTSFVGVDNLKVKITGDKAPFTYEATFETQAIQTESQMEWFDPPEEPPTELVEIGDEEYNPPEEDELVQLGGPEEISPDEDPAETARLQRQNDAATGTPVGQEESEATAPAPTVTPAAQSTPAAAAPADLRFRISLASGADYFYKSTDPGILSPLKHTNGVVFPYMPTVSVAYNAQYAQTEVTHSNYKLYNYTSSSVDSITITGDFTAQDSAEANYLLAVIHFFRSCTKMFYGKSSHRGVPPPMLYLSGLGQYQFDNHPVVLQGFTYSLPTDVDYINAYPNGASGRGTNGAQIKNFDLDAVVKNSKIRSLIGGAASRLFGSGLSVGGSIAGTKKDSAKGTTSTEVTRVPTKISISLTLIPMISRYAMSNEFSLDDYASGKLLRGSVNPRTGGGVW